MDTTEYDIEYEDGSINHYFANIIAENIYQEDDSEGCNFMVMKEIIDHWKNYWTIPHEKRIPKRITVGCELLIEWTKWKYELDATKRIQY